MTQFINKIDATLFGTEKQVVIDLQGKNLIITGANGCGKTRFLNQINNDLLHRLSIPSVAVTGEVKLENASLCNSELVLELLHKNQLLIRFFEATRQYKTSGVNHGLTVEAMRNEAKQNDLRGDTSVNFETYLVTYLNAGYMAFALRQDQSEKNKVDVWLANITKDLRFLFEDDSLELEYREKEKRFYIKQQGKEPYTFEQLSSGYSAILAIYADLLMKVELREITPKELSGIVLIDEIDAHLHVSLQKKILAFFDQAYPNIQFIVSTHSSLVIQSVDNAVIYDLSKLEQLENLSMYSADAITKGLLGTQTNSNNLNDAVSELSQLTADVEANQARVQELIELLRDNEKGLDARAKVALLMAEQALVDHDLVGE